MAFVLRGAAAEESGGGGRQPRLLLPAQYKTEREEPRPLLADSDIPHTGWTVVRQTVSQN